MSCCFRPIWSRRVRMAGKSSALCFIWPEKVSSAFSCGPVAIATEPALLEVSTANIKDFFIIIVIFSYDFLIIKICLKVVLSPQKTHFLDGKFSPRFPKLFNLLKLQFRYYRASIDKSNFSLQISFFLYKLGL